MIFKSHILEENLQQREIQEVVKERKRKAIRIAEEEHQHQDG